MVINSPGYFSVQYAKEFGISNDMMLPFFQGIFQEAVVGKADLKELLIPVIEKWRWKGTVEELLEWWFKAEHYVDERVVEEIGGCKKRASSAVSGQSRKNTERLISAKIWVLKKYLTNSISPATWDAKNRKRHSLNSFKTILRRNFLFAK